MQAAEACLYWPNILLSSPVALCLVALVYFSPFVTWACSRIMELERALVLSGSKSSFVFEETEG